MLDAGRPGHFGLAGMRERAAGNVSVLAAGVCFFIAYSSDRYHAHLSMFPGG